MSRLAILTLCLLVGCKELPDETPFSNENFNSGGGEPEIIESVTPPSNPLCGPTRGFLWKPEADQNSRSPGKAVVLLPGAFSVQFDAVCVVGSDRDECATESGFLEDRQVWRFSRPGCAYGRNFRVIAQEDKQTCEFQVPRGCRRREL